jgi:hypothetical protein
MRFRTGLLLGVAIGYVLGSRAAERGERPAVGPGGDLAERGRRLVDEATRLAADALGRAREGIRDRLGEPN